MNYNFNLGLPSVGTLSSTDLSNVLGNYSPALTDLNFMQSASPTAGLGSLNGMSVATQPGILDQLKASFSNMPWATTTGANGMKTQGLFDMGLGAAQGLLGAYLGFQNLGIAKDTLAQNKYQFQTNLANQVKTTNAALEDRQRARVASNPNAYASVSDYMAKNGL